MNRYIKVNPFITQFVCLYITLLSTTTIAIAEQYGDFSYTSDGSTISITDYTGTNTFVVIPDIIDNLPVTKFTGFYDNRNVTNIVVGKNVTSLKQRQFADCRNLISVTMSDSITSIGEYAFSYCWSLTSLKIPNGIANIGPSAFYNCRSLKSITIPNNITTLSADMLRDCLSLTNVVLPNTITSIPTGFFSNCWDLPSVTIPESVTYIGRFAFHRCLDLNNLYFEGNAPGTYGNGGEIFLLVDNCTVYRQPDASGWSTTFCGLPVSQYITEEIQIDANCEVLTNSFCFNVTGVSAAPFVLEACENLTLNSWVPLATNTLLNGLYAVSDSQWTNYPTRYYRAYSTE